MEAKAVGAYVDTWSWPLARQRRRPPPPRGPHRSSTRRASTSARRPQPAQRTWTLRRTLIPVPSRGSSSATSRSARSSSTSTRCARSWCRSASCGSASATPAHVTALLRRHVRPSTTSSRPSTPSAGSTSKARTRRPSRRWRARCTSRLPSGCAEHDPVSNQVVSWVQDHSVLILAALAVRGRDHLPLAAPHGAARSPRDEGGPGSCHRGRASRCACRSGSHRPRGGACAAASGPRPDARQRLHDDAPPRTEAEAAAAAPAVTVLPGPGGSGRDRGARRSPSRATAPAGTSLTSSEVEERLRQYER